MDHRIVSPFGAFTPAREVAAGHDLRGTTALITGAATGIGLETARALADAGAEVVILARKPDLVAQAIEDLSRTATGPRPRFESVDLARLGTIRAFADRWGQKPVHLLINNAGVMACPPGQTEEGFEMQLGTNHLGHFLLSTLLLPSLEAGAQGRGRSSRVVSLSSIGHHRSAMNFDDPHFRQRPYDKWTAYGQSKTANALFAVGWDHRFGPRGVRANAVMPGGIMTPLQRHLPREEMIAFGWIDEAGQVAQGFKTPEEGASTSVWAAIGPELENVGGLYLENCAQALPKDEAPPRTGVAPWALDPAQADRLWDFSVAEVGLSGVL